MNINGKFKEWPEEKKKVFSIFTAGIITVAVVIIWFSFNPIFQKSDVSVENNDSVNYLKESFQKFSDQFDSAKDQVSNLISNMNESSTTSTSSTEVASSTNNR